MLLKPGYGRTYLSHTEAEKAMHRGTKFVILTPGPDCMRYVTKADLLADGVTHAYVTLGRAKNPPQCRIDLRG